MTSKIKVAFLITTLEVGGAERYLQRSLRHMDRERFQALVLVLGKRGVVGEELIEEGFEVISFDVQNAIDFLKSVWGGLKELKSFKPDLIHAWMYHAMLWSVPLAVILRTPSLWSIRNAELKRGYLPFSTRCLAKILSLLSSWTSGVLFNSRRAQEVHEALGYDPKRSELLYNGFDCSSIQVKTDHGKDDNTLELKDFKSPLNAPQAFKVLFVSRDHPQKDVATFLSCVEQLKVRSVGPSRGIDQPYHFYTCGRGLGKNDESFQAQLVALGIEDVVTAVGAVSNVEEYMKHADVLILTSREESFPNAIGEAMALGLICISTNVGDVVELLAPEQICDLGDVEALCRRLEEIKAMSDSEKKKIQERQWARLRDHFDITKQQKKLETLWLKSAKVSMSS